MSQAEQSVQRLVEAGEELTPELERELLAHGAGAVAPLLRLLSDESLRAEDSPGQGWAPIHAAMLLGVLKEPSAIPAMLAQLQLTEPGEYLQEALIEALQGFGEAAIEPVLALLRERPNDETLHDFACEVLSGLGVRDPRILQTLLDELARDPVAGALRLGDYGDPAALPALSRTFDACARERPPDAWSQELVELAASIEELGGLLSDAQRLELKRTRDAHHSIFASLLGSGDLPAVREERPGRNAPCWCGSGQKYKRCHLAEDQHGGDTV
jgi:hypothetical protein